MTARTDPCGGHLDEGGICGATAGVRLYLIGRRCPLHTPAARAGRPETTPTPVVPSPPRPTPAYGSARTDPLGREGPGWHIGPSKLPTRTKP